MTKLWTDDMVVFLKTLPYEMRRKKMAQLVNEKFATQITERQVTKKLSLIYRDKKKTKTPSILTEEQFEYFLQINENKTSNEVALLMNKKFNTNFKDSQISNIRYSRGLLSNVDTRFKKGYSPANKGTKGLFNVGGNSGSFKKGQIGTRRVPLGSERFQHNRIFVKVDNTGNPMNDWRPKNRVVWEKYHGEIPNGYKIIYLDGDLTNHDISNLAMATGSEILSLTNNNLRFKEKELTKTGLNIVRLKNKVKEIEKQKGE